MYSTHVSGATQPKELAHALPDLLHEVQVISVGWGWSGREGRIIRNMDVPQEAAFLALIPVYVSVKCELSGETAATKWMMSAPWSPLL